MRWAEVHQNKPWLSRLTLKNHVVGRTISLIGASGTTDMLKCNLLSWVPNPCIIVFLTSFLYIRVCMCIYMRVCVYMHINNYICLHTKYNFYIDSF